MGRIVKEYNLGFEKTLVVSSCGQFYYRDNSVSPKKAKLSRLKLLKGVNYDGSSPEVVFRANGVRILVQTQII